MGESDGTAVVHGEYKKERLYVDRFPKFREILNIPEKRRVEYVLHRGMKKMETRTLRRLTSSLVETRYSNHYAYDGEFLEETEKRKIKKDDLEFKSLDAKLKLAGI